MTALLWVAAVFALIGLTDIVLRVSVIDGKSELVLSVLFVRKKLIGGEKKAKKAKTQKQPAQAKAAADKEIKKDPFFGSVAEAVELVQGMLSPVGKFITGIRISKLRLFLSVGGSDAAETAIRYGQMQAAVHLSLTALRRHFRVTAKEIAVTPNFFTEKTALQLSFQVRVSIGSAMGAACRGLWVFIKHFMKQKGKNLRKGRKKPVAAQEES